MPVTSIEETDRPADGTAIGALRGLDISQQLSSRKGILLRTPSSGVRLPFIHAD